MMAASSASQPLPNSLIGSAAQFREIHKNSWLKRLTAEGKKITVGGVKKSDRSWVVFCIHDDTEALLEGYSEPRQAASHCPEWIIQLQDTLHISHALIPNSHEFEFVVTLSNEVVRFHAMSWEIMQEWVDALRSKLREMKILSPRENLYTKLPESRAPLLPTRDPTSPLPAPPPVPAAIVPGIERIPSSSISTNANTIPSATASAAATNAIPTATAPETACEIVATTSTVAAFQPVTASSSVNPTATFSAAPNSTMATNNVTTTSSITATPLLSAMSNTLSQNLLNLLSDPISAYSEHINDANTLHDFENLTLSGDEQSLEEQTAEEFENGALLRNLTTLIRPYSLGATVSSCDMRNDQRSSNHRSSADHVDVLVLSERQKQPRPSTVRSQSVGAADKQINAESNSIELPNNTATLMQHVSNSDNITELEISSTDAIPTSVTSISSTIPSTGAEEAKSNITIIQVSTTETAANDSKPATAEILPQLPLKNQVTDVFQFPESTLSTGFSLKSGAMPHSPALIKSQIQPLHDYKSNVQIIPSNMGNNITNKIKVLHDHMSTNTNIIAKDTNGEASMNFTPITMVHVVGVSGSEIVVNNASNDSGSAVQYGTCYNASSSTNLNISPKQLTPKLSKKIILTANSSGITNIAVNNSNSSHLDKNRTSSETEADATGTVRQNVGNVHYEKVFLSSSIPMPVTHDVHPATLSSSSSSATAKPYVMQSSPKLTNFIASPRHHQVIKNQHSIIESPEQTATVPIIASESDVYLPIHNTTSGRVTSACSATANAAGINDSPSKSPARRRIASPSAKLTAVAENVAASGSSSNTTDATSTQQQRPPLLRRGLTEAVISTRPSRRDFSNILRSRSPTNTKSTSTTNNNGEHQVGPSAANGQNSRLHALVSRTQSESMEQRRRSSSTSDAQAGQRNTSRNNNNNDLPRAGAALRIQQPPQPFRVAENGGGSPMGENRVPAGTNSPAGKRMTSLREQQVMQLRREIAHPGGVRLQLRRKDCVGSIAWVDAFGAVWIGGWKQKDHPVLYNAIHIGDQLLTIAGSTVSTAADANKIIRNTNTLFIEVLIRRLPFGRCYAVRREREGQCLGLIRDGNTSTIVDIVPNSLAARHGLPPKAQSCDGTTLTFWVLTEINARPLNLFFKENEIRDRLNAVGRDISLLVQPADLIAKLKKQLKSMRGYKDYLVQ